MAGCSSKLRGAPQDADTRRLKRRAEFSSFLLCETGGGARDSDLNAGGAQAASAAAIVPPWEWHGRAASSDVAARIWTSFHAKKQVKENKSIAARAQAKLATMQAPSFFREHKYALICASTVALGVGVGSYFAYTTRRVAPPASGGGAGGGAPPGLAGQGPATGGAGAEAGAGTPVAARPSSEEELLRLEQSRRELEGRRHSLRQEEEAAARELRQVEAELQGELQATAAPSTEGLSGASVQSLAGPGLTLLYDRVAPVFSQTDAVRQVVERRVAEVRSKVPEMLQEELRGGLSDLDTVLQGILPSVNVGNLDHLPPFSLMLAGLCAPAQLRALNIENLARLGVCASLFSVDLLTLIVDNRAWCVTNSFAIFGHKHVLQSFVTVDAIVLGFMVLVSLQAFLECQKTFSEIQAHAATPLDVPADPEEALRAQLEHHLINGSRAMLAYDRLTHSLSFRMLPVISIFDFFWQMGGWVVLFGTPVVSCEAKLTLYWARTRGVIFLVGFLPSLFGLVRTGIKIGLQSRAFGTALLQGGQAADQMLFPTGPPLVTVFVRSFWVRGAVDVTALELQVLRAEEAKLNHEVARVRAEHGSREAELVGLEAKAAEAEARANAQAQRLALDVREQEFMRQYQDAVRLVLDAADTTSRAARVVATGAVTAADMADATAAAMAAMGVQGPPQAAHVAAITLGAHRPEAGADAVTAGTGEAAPPR